MGESQTGTCISVSNPFILLLLEELTKESDDGTAKKGERIDVWIDVVWSERKAWGRSIGTGFEPYGRISSYI